MFKPEVREGGEGVEKKKNANSTKECSLLKHEIQHY